MKNEQGYKIIKVSSIPKCDLCGKVNAGIYDGPMLGVGSSWANMCQECLDTKADCVGVKMVGGIRVVTTPKTNIHLRLVETTDSWVLEEGKEGNVSCQEYNLEEVVRQKLVAMGLTLAQTDSMIALAHANGHSKFPFGIEVETVTGIELTSFEDIVTETEDREIECPRCGETRTMEPDARDTFKCSGCGVNVKCLEIM